MGGEGGGACTKYRGAGFEMVFVCLKKTLEYDTLLVVFRILASD